MTKRSVKEQIKYAFLWLFFIWISCLLSILIDLLVMKIVTSIVVISFRTEAIIHLVVMMLGAAAPLGAVSYLISHHIGEFSLLDSMLEGVPALLLHTLAGFLLGFPVWISGGVKWLAGFFQYGNRFNGFDPHGDLDLVAYLLAALVFAVFYLVVKTVLGYVGRTVRIRQRIELTGSPVKPTERDSASSDN